jgi:alkanesulfonate monooxygenase SsuD/methylene tetrahydromethanopterin reductase-like flavin-dependent oxidoreductase (luciferase family)
MRVGISLMYWPWFTPQEQLALAQQADRLGLHSVWVAEGYGQEAAAMLGLLAGRTDRILFGAGILQIPARQPTTAAMVASTVDRLSGGRMLLGLGLSGPQVCEGWYGVPFTAPLRRTREYVEIVRLALSGQRVAYDGTEWSMPARGGLGLGKPLKLIAAPSAARSRFTWAPAGSRPSSRRVKSPTAGPRSCSAPRTPTCSPRRCSAASTGPAGHVATSRWPRWSSARSTTTSTAPATRCARC